MSNQTITEESKFVLNGNRCEVANLYRVDNEMRYREYTDDENPYYYTTRLLKISEFQNLLQSGDAKVEDVSKKTNEMYLTDEQLTKMHYRQQYVEQCFKENPNGPTTERAVKQAKKVVSRLLKDLSPPGDSTIQGWVKKYRDTGGSQYALLDEFLLTNAKRRRYPIEIEEAFSDCISNYYLVNKPRSYKFIYQKFKQLVAQIIEDNKGDPAYDITIPCESTLVNRLRAYTDEEALIAKYGKTKAKQKIREKLKKFRVDTILQRVEMDGLHIHLGLVDTKGKGGKPRFIGSIVLMCVIDVYSRVLIGYSIYVTKKKAEPTDLIVQCLKHALSYDRDKRWPSVHSIPCLVTDASSSATGSQWEGMIQKYGLTVVIATSQTPQEKPFVESFNNTLRRMFLKHLFGYIGREKFRGQTIKLHNSVEEQACMTLDDFVNEFEHFIHEIYHKKPHSGLHGRAPIDVWNEEMNHMPEYYKSAVNLATGPEVFAITAERKYNKKENGFFVDGRWYKDSGLYKWLITGMNNDIGYAEKDVLNNVKLLYSHLDLRTITAIHPKTRQMRSIPLWDVEKLQIDVTKPIQRAEYKALVDAPLSNIEIADEIQYEPSELTRCNAMEVEANKKAVKDQIKRDRSKNKPEHKQVDSSEYKEEVTKHIEDNKHSNVIFNTDSNTTNDPNEHIKQDWEDYVSLDDVGGCDDEL